MAQEATQADVVRALIIRAQTAYDRGRYKDALDEYNKALVLIPGFPDLYKAIGQVYERMGGDNDLQAAIENYQKYLALSPEAQDKDAIQDHLISLGYIYEVQLEQTAILDNLSGIWISIQRPDYKGAPAFIFKVSEIAGEGIFRIEILPESAFYSGSIIRKTANITPNQDNSFTFSLADAESYIPSQAKYQFLRSLIPTNNPWVQSLGNVGVTAVQEKDLPSNTKTEYSFKFQYVDGLLQGRCNILKQKADTRSTQVTQDDYFEISLRKDAPSYYNRLTSDDMMATQRRIVIGKWAYRNASGIRLNTEDINDRLRQEPDLYKKYKSGDRSNVVGAFILVFGSLPLLIGGLVTLSNNAEAGAYVLAGSGGLMLVGFPLVFRGTAKQKQAINEYNARLNGGQGDQSYLHLGSTPSGGLGLVLYF